MEREERVKIRRDSQALATELCLNCFIIARALVIGHYRVIMSVSQSDS